jgi:hypothetical protein
MLTAKLPKSHSAEWLKKARIKLLPNGLWRKEDFAMEQLGLDQRHRDKNGEIARKHGNTLIATLRRIYGRGFAPGCGDHEKLSDVLRRMNEHSLSLLVHDHQHGALDGKIDKAGRSEQTIRATWDPPQDRR